MNYKSLSEYFKERYGRRLKKICIDGGFSCPNRDGRCGEGGCIFCGERGAGEHIDPSLSIRRQVERGLEGRSPDELFVAYFQNFTNTYAPVSTLKERYDSALIDERIRVLAIGTRPDCIDEGVAELIASYKDKVDVWVELGLQTASDRTAKIINRGYETSVYKRAKKILDDYGIPVVVHIIIGLPGEGREELSETVELIKQTAPFGLKIHSIYVSRGTRLCELYERGEYTPPTMEEYIDSAVYALSRIGDEVVIHRLTGDCPRELLAAPAWNTEKSKVIDEIRKRLSLL